MQASNSSPQQVPSSQISQQMLQAKIESLKLEQNIGLGVIGGTLGGGIGAILWALITYFTEYQIGWMAVGVGFLVGLGVRLLGRGIDKVFGIMGAIIALASVILGNFLVSLGFLAKELGMSYLDVLVNFNYSMTLELMMATFSPMDLLFFAIAVYEGYRFSFRRITQKDLLGGAIGKP